MGRSRTEVGVGRSEPGTGSPGWESGVRRPQVGIRRWEAQEAHSIAEVSVVGRPGPPGERRTVGPGTGSRESVCCGGVETSPGQWVYKWSFACRARGKATPFRPASGQ